MAIGSVGKKSMRRGRRGGRMSEINVTPLVDVMLVLLIIFMVTAPMITAGVNIDLPETNAQASRTDEEPLEVTVDRRGNIYLADKKISQKELPKKLAAIYSQNQDKLIMLRGDERINYGKFAEVMGEINAAGFRKITLITGVK